MINLERLWTFRHIIHISWILFSRPSARLIANATSGKSDGTASREASGHSKADLNILVGWSRSLLLSVAMSKQPNSVKDIPAVIPSDALALLNVAQARMILCVSRGTLYNLIRGGELRCIKIRSSTRFQRSELNRFISEKAKQASTEN